MDYLSKESELNINIGKIIPLKRMNTILFGTKNEWVIDKILLLNSGLVKQINNNYFLLTNKVSSILQQRVLTPFILSYTNCNISLSCFLIL